MDRAIRGQCLSEDVKAALFSCYGLKYDRGSGVRLGFDSLFIDNALAHLSDSVCDKLRREAGAAVTYGAVKRPERRGLVEHVFSWMAKEVFHQSRATTGNSPNDTRRIDPEREAVRNKVTLMDIMQATENAVTLWNNRATEANYGCSPAAQMLDYYSNTCALSPLCPRRECSCPR